MHSGDAVRTRLQLPDTRGHCLAGAVYGGLEDSDAVYRLRSMVCYYGAHYQAFVRRPDSAAWQLFDDASVSDVDSWHHVRSKCERGHIQPAVLFFEAEEGG